MTLLLVVGALLFFLLAVLGINVHPRVNSLALALLLWFILTSVLGSSILPS